MSASQKFTPRTVVQAVVAQEHAEGQGARVRRSIGTNEVRHFTPFLMLDHGYMSPDAGFPDHPHRGQETITYVLKGHIDHEDFTGSRGTLGPGDLQFMTAGRGIVHAEMPRIDKDADGDINAVEGLQLWVDLPQELKNCEPRYRDLRAAEVPVATPNDKVQVKVISGESFGVKSMQELAYTPVWLLDVTLQPGGRIEQAIPADFNAFIYQMSGTLSIAGKQYPAHTSTFFNTSGDGIKAAVPETAAHAARFIVVAGKMLNQKIVQHGPFVETSQEKIVKAFKDFETRSNGFERAAGWRSEIGQRMR